MKQLITALSIVLVIAACKSNPTDSKPEFEPYEVGTWLITSPTSAEWIGKTSNQSKIKTMQSDTIEIKQPSDRSLELWRDSTMAEYAFKMQFTDSSVTIEDHWEHDIQSPGIQNPRATNDEYPLGAEGPRNEITEDFMRSTFDMIYLCDRAGFSKNAPIIQITYKKGDGSIFRVYNIHVNGILDAVRDILPSC